MQADRITMTTTSAGVFVGRRGTVFALVRYTTKTSFYAYKIVTVIAKSKRVVDRRILIPSTVVFLPITTDMFVGATRASFQTGVFGVFTHRFTNFATDATTKVSGGSVLYNRKLLLGPFQSKRSYYTANFPLPTIGNNRESRC